MNVCFILGFLTRENELFSFLKIIILCVSFPLFLYGCNDENTHKNKEVTEMKNIPLISESTKEALLKIRDKKIVFGHHSVGKNILDGLNNVAKEAGVELNFSSINNTSENKINFIGFYPGKNTFPKSKVDDFVKRIQNINADHSPDIALMKFCYIDINTKTNVEEMFRYYKEKIDKLKKDKPKIILAHFTVPLVARSNTLKTKIKQFLGMQIWQEASNIKRNEFNKLVYKAFNKNLIFDIARIESTRLDGSREQFNKDGKIYYQMLPEYTIDGGHLNRLGKRIAAIEMVSFLDKIIEEKNNK